MNIDRRQQTTWFLKLAFWGALCFGVGNLTMTAQTTPRCDMVVTTHDAARCIASVSTESKILTIDPNRTYTLPELIDIAEMTSPEARIAWASAKRSLEEAAADRAMYLPILALAAQGSDSRFIVPFPKPIAPRGYVTVEQPIALAQLQMEYSLLDFARGPKVDAGKALELASTLRFSRKTQQVAYATATQFYKAQLEMGRLSAAQTILETAETLLANAQSQYDNGRATLPDVQNAQAGVAEAKFDLASAEGAVKKAKLDLTEAIGVEPTTQIQIPLQQEVESPDELTMNVEELIQVAWKTRPDLLARIQDSRRAKDASRSAHSAYLPNVGLVAAGGQTATWPSADWGQLGYANVSTWSVQTALRWEIFNGARSHEVRAAWAEQKAAIEEQRATQDAVTREVWQSYVDYQTTIEQHRSSLSYLKAAETSYDSSLDAYKYGVRSLVDVVQAERQLAQARLTAVQSNAQLLQSAIAISYATGQLQRNGAALSGVKP